MVVERVDGQYESPLTFEGLAICNSLSLFFFLFTHVGRKALLTEEMTLVLLDILHWRCLP